MAEKKKKPSEKETPVDAVVTDEPAAEEHVAGEPVAEVVADEPVAEEPAVEELVAKEVPVAEVEVAEAEAEPEPVVDAPVATEPEPKAAVNGVVEAEPAEEAEPVVEEAAVAESVPAEEPAAEKPAAKAPAPAAAEAPAAPAPQSGPKAKKKRLPRPLRPQKGRVVRVKPETRKPIVRLEKPEHERGRSQERQGTVISDAMEKTIVVKVDTIKAHRKYKKVVRRSNTFHAHDERNEAKVGDVVRIVETRPLSKMKRWRLAEIVEAAK